jgi:hypothetical protein
LYCSKRWMGNPGCFENLHVKGNRSRHSYTKCEVDEQAYYATAKPQSNSKGGKAFFSLF